MFKRAAVRWQAMYDTILILADTVESSEHDTEKTDSDNLACLLRMKDIIEKQVSLPTAPQLGCRTKGRVRSSWFPC